MRLRPDAIVPIPVGHVLLHIGLPKSGTTSLQMAAARRRRELAREGVLYPGRGINHRLAFSAVMGRRSTGSSRQPRTSDWSETVRACASRDSRSLLSYELVCAADDVQAERIVADLGPERTHVVLTVRAQSAMLPSIWQQYVKTNQRRTFDAWAHAVLDDPSARSVTPSFWLRHDLGEVAQRWARLVGVEQVTVVVLDRAEPDRLPRAFEGLLGLPTGALEASEDLASENRSLTYAEIELIRRVQRRVRKGGLGSRRRSELIVHGIAPALQARPAVKEDVGKVRVARWVDEAAQRLGKTAAARLAELDVDVIGELEELAAPGRTVTEQEALRLPRRISVDAVAVAVGALADLVPAVPTVAPRRSLSPDTSLASAAVRGRLESTRGSGWVRRHSYVLKGLEEGEARAQAKPVSGTLDLVVAAAMVAGVMSRVAWRGEFFARRPQQGSVRERVLDLWMHGSGRLRRAVGA